MVRVVFRHGVAPGNEDAFVAAWECLKSRMLERATGVLEATLLRCVKDPTQFSTVTRWRSLEDWNAYWNDGVPDPEGDFVRNGVFVEVKTVLSPVT